jgi:hypothetical protein
VPGDALLVSLQQNDSGRFENDRAVDGFGMPNPHIKKCDNKWIGIDLLAGMPSVILYFLTQKSPEHGNSGLLF